jgi:hypothetical protein
MDIISGNSYNLPDFEKLNLKGWIRNENVQVKNVVDIFMISEMNRNVRYIGKKK